MKKLPQFLKGRKFRNTSFDSEGSKENLNDTVTSSCSLSDEWEQDTESPYINDVEVEVAKLAKCNYENLIYLTKVKEELENEGFVWLPGQSYRAILVHFGALEEDLKMIESGHIHNQVKRDIEATMHFRQIAVHRVLISEDHDLLPSKVGQETEKNDLSRCALLSRSPPQFVLADAEAVTQISDKEICSDEGAKVYFKRSGNRRWNLPPPAYTKSTVPLAIARFNSFLLPKTHHFQSNLKSDSKITINDQILIRVNKEHSNDEAEPTPEGIHQDGTEISSVTLISRKNVDSNIGSESRIWNLRQPTGNYDSTHYGKLTMNGPFPAPEGFDWDNCLFNKALDSPWETIVFNDREVKHEVRAFHRREDAVGKCYRDVLVNFCRKPLSDGSDIRKDNISNRLVSIQ